MCSSTSRLRAPGSRPTLSRPTAARLGTRPAATSSFSPLTTLPSDSVTSTPSGLVRTPATDTPVRTGMPSRAKTSASRSPASGSSRPSNRGPVSITVTAVPKRAMPCASSQLMTPPPTTTIERGATRVLSRSRLVHSTPSTPVDSSPMPSIGGIAGAVPVAMTTPGAACVSPLTSTSRRPDSSRPASRPVPRMNLPPRFSSRSTATVSSQSSVASVRMRVATGPKSGSSDACPASWSTRRDSPSTSAARSTIFDGMQPK